MRKNGFRIKCMKKTSKVSADNEKSYGTFKRNEKYRASDKGDEIPQLKRKDQIILRRLRMGKSMIL